MRVSSVIRPSSSGTLKSARTNTRVPFRSGRSLTVRFAIALQRRDRRGSQRWNSMILRSRRASADSALKSVLAAVARGHVADQVLHPVREAPLVVVPGEDLGQVAVDHLGERGVDD